MTDSSETARPTGVRVRQCPTQPGDVRPLIAHTIGVSLCLKRQREFYHKCHRCQYRGKPADYVTADDAVAGDATAS